jgi:hypothetical protein
MNQWYVIDSMTWDRQHDVPCSMLMKNPQLCVTYTGTIFSTRGCGGRGGSHPAEASCREHVGIPHCGAWRNENLNDPTCG